jgi:hypothetical protein
VAADNREHSHAWTTRLLTVSGGKLFRSLALGVVGIRAVPNVEFVASVEQHDVVRLVKQRLLREIGNLLDLELARGICAVKQANGLLFRLRHHALEVLAFAAEKRPPLLRFSALCNGCFGSSHA